MSDSRLQSLFRSAERALEAYRQMAAFKLTSLNEGGLSGSWQNKDSGIVSFGKHQATLASGALERVLEEFFKLSDSATAQSLREYLPRVKVRAESLRNDEGFKDLLLLASREPEMESAQDRVFEQDYWQPASRLATSLGLNSALAHAVIYDTKIQGGLQAILKSTTEELARPYAEKEFLDAFLNKREDYLLKLAAGRRASNRAADAAMLEASAKNRVGRLRGLLQRGDYWLSSLTLDSFAAGFASLRADVAIANQRK